MPNQTSVAGRIKFYGQNDTAPPLKDVIETPEGEVVDLSDAAGVYITISWTSYSFYYAPYRPIVDRALCVIDDAALGEVSWHPQPGDLHPIGSFAYSFEVKWNDDTVSTHKALAYDYIRVQTPPGGSRKDLP
jgi:hypothetical protein